MSKSFNESAHKIAREIADLVVSKQHDYGPKNILNCPAGVYTGILVRMYDKFARIQNLISKQENAKNEPLEDAWRDIMGYAMIGLMIMKNEFELPLNDKKQQTQKENY